MYSGDPVHNSVKWLTHLQRLQADRMIFESVYYKIKHMLWALEDLNRNCTAATLVMQYRVVTVCGSLSIDFHEL
jgi:hypothetical protein